jgi:hypothetical protein
MKWSLRFLSLCLLLMTSHLVADVGEPEDIDDDDVRALREWLNTKRQVTIKEKGGALSISGEVRAEYQATNERKGGIKQRGYQSATGKPNNGFDVEATFLMDYRTERTWAAIRIRFDNDAGIISGTDNKVKLDRAYLGARLIEKESHTLDAEIGRRKLGNIFDSKIEFDSRFDGILLSYDAYFERIANFYTHVGAFVIDERRSHYGYVGEIGLLNVANTGFYTKYSLTDWNTRHYDVPISLLSGDKFKVYTNLNQRFDYIVSQLILGYRFIPANLDKLVLIYAAGLYNHRANKISLTRHKRLNWGAYTGFSIGELKKKGDWALDVNYQLVAPQAIPDFDVSGIGLGNADASGFYTKNDDGTGGTQTRATAGGKVNYRGYQLTLEYLLTNNISLFQSWQDAMTLYSDVGPFRRFKQYELEFIYGF